MPGWAQILLFLVAYIVIVRWLLPKMGVST
jgi:hypothetical protein